MRKSGWLFVIMANPGTPGKPLAILIMAFLIMAFSIMAFYIIAVLHYDRSSKLKDKKPT